MYGRHLEYRISQSLRNLTHSHHTTRATGDESGLFLRICTIHARPQIIFFVKQCLTLQDDIFISIAWWFLPVTLSFVIIRLYFFVYFGVLRMK